MITLKTHFQQFYRVISKQQSQIQGTDRYISGIPIHYHNAVLGVPTGDIDTFIEEQIYFFQKKGLPFAWYFDVEDPAFKQKLRDYRFQEIGVFQGMSGPLTKPFKIDLPPDCTIEQVTSLDEFNDVVCMVFGFTGKGKELFKKALHESPMSHWMLKKEGKGVAVLSTLQEDQVVSFWNMATLPDHQRQGYGAALVQWAFNAAMKKGCTKGFTYLTSEGMANGICLRLGLTPQWNFQVFFSPDKLYKY